MKRNPGALYRIVCAVSPDRLATGLMACTVALKTYGVHVYDKKPWNPSKARNSAFSALKAAEYKWAVFMDADTNIDAGRLKREVMSLDRSGKYQFAFLTPGTRDEDGFLVVRSDEFVDSGGYDEEIGAINSHETCEFRLRLRAAGLKYKLLPRELVTAVKHDDSWRSRNMPRGWARDAAEKAGLEYLRKKFESPPVAQREVDVLCGCNL